MIFDSSSLPHRLYRYIRLKMNNAIIRTIFRNKQPKKKYFLAVCAIFKNEGKFLKEWINYYLLAGVEHFYLYNNFSDDNYQELLQPYIDKGLVTLIDWPVPFGQPLAYQNCIETYAEEANWIGFLDLDEFVVPYETKDIKQWLSRYNQFPGVSCYWKMFSSNGILKEDPSKFLMEQFVICGDMLSYKSFLNTKFIGWLKKKNKSPHFFRFKFFNRVCAEDPLYYSGLRKKPKYIHAQCNHYFCKSYEYFYNKKLSNGSLSEKIKLSMNIFFSTETMAYTADYRIWKYLIEMKIFDLDEFCADRGITQR
ncbi:MAG: glycosyltransferase family 92 protein [Alphaproteobacteria bacterium]|nr:glycosyltransferase family 92 protein [Alphaproteobacteria bacterium]